MNGFWKYLNIVSLILIIALAGYVFYNRTMTQVEAEDPTQQVIVNKPTSGLLAKIKQWFSPEKPNIPTQSPVFKQPPIEDALPRLEPPLELQEQLQKAQRQGLTQQDTGTFVATRQPAEINANIPVVTEKVWQEGHWIGLEVGPLT
ncbi:MAG: hypothetical protein N2738_09700, partial [Thermodesulfovibrionales bacterium]|nr:hypothetical protein [Thermodesulfovibrionales bacterium]